MTQYISNSYSILQIQIWLAMAYEANRRHKDCIALYKELESSHPMINIRRQAAELRYILEAPKLKISNDEVVSIPQIGSSWDWLVIYLRLCYFLPCHSAMEFICLYMCFILVFWCLLKLQTEKSSSYVQLAYMNFVDCKRSDRFEVVIMSSVQIFSSLKLCKFGCILFKFVVLAICLKSHSWCYGVHSYMISFWLKAAWWIHQQF